MYLSDFEELNQKLMAGGANPFANPRNASAGALRQLDSRIPAQRPLHFLAFAILHLPDSAMKDDREALDALTDWGFKTLERVEVLKGVEEVLDYPPGVFPGPGRAGLRDRRHRHQGGSPRFPAGAGFALA